MQTVIMSRREIEQRGCLPFLEKTAVISITDVGYSFATLKNEPQYRLKLAFDDVDNDIFLDELDAEASLVERKAVEQKYHMFSDEQAEQVAEFYREIVSNGVELLIVQCEHGQSRSAAVAAAVCEFENGNGISIFADDRFWPNKVVFRKVLKELKNN